MLIARHKERIADLIASKGKAFVRQQYGVSAWTLSRFIAKNLQDYRPKGDNRPYRHPFYPSLFYVYRDGRIWSTKKFDWLKQRIPAHGYVMASNIRVHVAVLTAFKGPPKKGQEACHNDGVKSHCHLGNLRWGTKKENQADRVAHGTANIGSRNPVAKLNERHVRILKRRYKAGDKGVIKRYSAKHGVAIRTIYGAISGKRWTHA